ncbi:MAG: hypothetical protein IPI73_25945 [Betaproteobacteria bacterium]|nr:hypothetical protein [Betaproteobacteria bacterium]
MLVAPHVYASLGFDLKSFTPIAAVGALPCVLVSSRASCQNWAELIPLLKGKPGQFSYATGGIGGIPHLSGGLFQQLAGVKLLHVPYQGGGKLLTDVMSGEVPLAFISASPVLPLIRAGKLNLLAMTRLASGRIRARHQQWQSGSPAATAMSFFVLAPAEPPVDCAGHAQATVAQALKTKEVRSAFAVRARC